MRSVWKNRSRSERENRTRQRRRFDEDVWDQLKQCYDPEIPVNIVDLGLVYDCKLIEKPEGGTKVEVKMTLTAPGCGMGPAIAHDAQSKILSIDGVDEAQVRSRLGSAVEPKHDQRSGPNEARDGLIERCHLSKAKKLG